MFTALKGSHFLFLFMYLYVTIPSDEYSAIRYDSNGAFLRRDTDTKRYVRYCTFSTVRYGTTSAVQYGTLNTVLYGVASTVR